MIGLEGHQNLGLTHENMAERIVEEEEHGNICTGEKLKLFVRLIQSIWE